MAYDEIKENKRNSRKTEWYFQGNMLRRVGRYAGFILSSAAFTGSRLSEREELIVHYSQ